MSTDYLVSRETRLARALERIIRWNRNQARDQFGDENSAESWACVVEARVALAYMQAEAHTDSKLLGELLAVMNGDGGQRQDEVGRAQATQEALAKYHAMQAEDKCRGCNGHGQVGGLRQDGYHSDECPFCKGSGIEPAVPKEAASITLAEAWLAVGGNPDPECIAKQTKNDVLDAIRATRDSEQELYAASPTPAASTPDSASDRMEDALHQIAQWAKAYPLNVFPEPDFKKAHEVLQAAGMTLDAISASNVRHVITRVQKIVDAALASTPDSVSGSGAEPMTEKQIKARFNMATATYPDKRLCWTILVEFAKQVERHHGIT